MTFILVAIIPRVSLSVCGNPGQQEGKEHNFPNPDGKALVTSVSQRCMVEDTLN